MNVLLTSVGRRTYLINYFKEAVQPFKGAVYAVNSIETYSLKQADYWTVCPPIYSGEYVNFLLQYCIDSKVDILISLFDIDLPVLAKHKHKFEDIGVKVIVSDESVIQLCNDKWLTFKFLEEKNIPTPLTFLELEHAKEALNNQILSFPVVVKPRWGMGSIGIFIADTFEELDVFYKKTKREILNSYLKFESEEDLDKSVLIQQAIKGGEFGAEVLNDLSGKYVNTFQKQKSEMRAGETDQAVTIENDEITNIAIRLSRELQHVGILDVDILKEGESFYVLELNARFGGQYPFSHLAGANVPAQLLAWANGSETNLEYCSIDIGLKGSKDITPVLS